MAENLIKQQLITTMGEKFKMSADEFKAALMATVLKPDKLGRPATLGEVNAFLAIANEHGLNPFKREIYAFKGKDGGIHPMVPIDGWTNIVNGNPQFDGVEFEDTFGDDGHIFSIKCRIHRKDLSIPVEVTEYFGECAMYTKKGEIYETWGKWPIRMLRHKAFMQCARLAFSLGGIYDPDEAERFRAVTDAEVVDTGLDDLKGQLPAGNAPGIPFGGNKPQSPVVDGKTVPESPEDGWKPPEGAQEAQDGAEAAQGAPDAAGEQDEAPERDWGDLGEPEPTQEDATANYGSGYDGDKDDWTPGQLPF